MKKLAEIREELQNALSVAFTCRGKDGYIDCYYNEERKKEVYHLRYGADEYDVTDEDEVFTLPFIAGRSLSDVYADVEIQPC